MTDSSWPNARANPFAPARLRLLGRAEALLAVAGIGAWAYDPRSATLWWSDETRRLHGVDAAYVPETATALDFYVPAGRDRVRTALADCIAAGVPWDVEVPLLRADGRRIWVRARGRRMDDAAGTVMGTFEDVTERRRAAREHERMALVVNQMTNAALITDAWGRTRWVNNAFVAFTGFTLAEVAGRLPEDYLVGPASDLSDLADVTAAMMAGEPFLREVVIHDAAGTAVWIELRVDPVRDTDGALTGFIAMTNDISARRESAAQAARELALRAGTETLLRDVIEGIPAALTVYDADERLVLVNDSYRTILPGAATLAAPGDRLEDIVRRKVAAGHYAPEITAAATPDEQAAWTADYLHRHRDADYSREFHLSDGRWVQARNARSTSGNIVSIRTDITRLKHAEAELRHVAEHDPLTGLVNRPVLMRRLAGHTARATGGTVVVIDVDFFKSLNDSLGHGAGDLLLRLVARRLQRLVGPGATVARLGGDEFALIVPGLVAADARAVFLDRLLAGQRRPVRLGANRYLPSVSVGVAVFTGGRDTADLVLSNADAALYEAKRNGRGRFALFDAELAARVERRTSLADRLRVAIAQRRLQVALQPQLRLADGAITGFEALARWHDGGEWVPPAEFVAIAEDVGLAQALGTAVMDRALAAHAGLVAAGLAPGILAVNVSTAQLLADDFLDVVRTLLARHGLPPQQLEIEVTETVLLDRSGSRIVQILAALRDDGISVSLDDFGTGYASLSSLRAFSVDRIKIDAGFTRAIDGHASDTAPGVATSGVATPGVATDAGLIARTIVVLGNGLGLEVIAEGVETPAQLAFLAASGCTAVQGYLVAPPMLPPAAAAWLAAINAAAADRAAVAARLQARIASRIVAE